MRKSSLIVRHIDSRRKSNFSLVNYTAHTSTRGRKLIWMEVCMCCCPCFFVELCMTQVNMDGGMHVAFLFFGIMYVCLFVCL